MSNIVSLARHRGYKIDTLINALNKLIKPLGDWNHFLFSGARVILKVNLVSPAPRERNALTDPAIVEALKPKLIGSEKKAILKRHTEKPEVYNLYTLPIFEYNFELSKTPKYKIRH